MSETEKIISKNFDLSVSFSQYLMTHPAVAKRIEKNSVVFFEVKNTTPFNRALNRLNLRLVENSLKAGENCYRAVNLNSTWKVEKLSPIAA